MARVIRPSVHPSHILCLLCSTYSFSWIHFIYICIYIYYIYIYTSYQATSEGVSHLKFLTRFQNLRFWQFLKICKFDFVFFCLGIWCESLVWVIMGWWWLFQNAGVLVVLVVLVLQDIHHNIIVFQHQLNVDRIWEQYWIHAILMHTELCESQDNVMWNPLNEVHIISHGDNWYFSDSNWICFQLKIHEMVIEIKMKMIPIISFSVEAICVSHIIISIFKFILTLINLMAIISDINMWLAVIENYSCTVNNGHWINDGVIVYLTIYDACTVSQ